MRPLAQKMLADRSFDIEFHGYLTNHIKHAIIALDRLDASNARIQEYWDKYAASTPYNLPLHKVKEDWNQVKPASAGEWKAWRGQKVNWQAQVALMQQELQARNSDADKLVADYAPEMLPGIMGALTHAIIHVGWAIDAASPWMITEGLAYLNFAHMGISESQFTWNAVDADAGPMETFGRVAETWESQNLAETWIARAKAAHDETFHPELVPAGFQWEFAKVVDQPHAVVTQLPTWISTMDINDVWESMYRATVYLYLATRDSVGHGNFLVLHLMTSLWALEKTLNVIKDDTIGRKAIGYYYAGMISLLSTAASGFPSKAALTAIQDQFPTSAVDAGNLDWTETVKAGIAEEEEHNIKLVYVMKELWHRYNHWKGFSEASRSFTLTPNIGPKQTAFTQ